MRRRAALVLLAVATAAAARAESHEPQLAAEAQAHKLLADRAWFSQIARVHRTNTAGAAASAAASCTAADPDGVCLVVVEPLQPGSAVEGYELVERTALLGVCRQPTDESVVTAQIADTQCEHALVGAAALAPSTRELALRVSLRDHSAIHSDREEGDDDDEEDDSGGDPSHRDGTTSSSSDATALDDEQTVCALPLAPSRRGHSTDVAQTSALAAGPTLEYQCSLDAAHLVYVNANYRLQTKFDAGSHGEVWRATRRRDGAQFVLKRLFLETRGEPMVQMGLREAHFGRVLAHELHVARFIEYFFRPTGAPSAQQELWLVFRDEGMSLRQYLYAKRQAPGAGVIFEPSAFWRRLRTDASGERVLREIMRQVLQGVAALHARGITHRDIKPSNILVAVEATNASAAPLVKLADFGSAVDAFTLRHLYAHGGPSQAEETREYQPPEVLFHDLGQPYDYAHPQAYDLWSVGVVFLELLIGSPDVFEIAPRARAKLDAVLPPGQSDAARRKSYLLHVLSHEFCIFQPPPHQLRALWHAHAVSADGCSFGRFNESVVARDPLRTGLANAWALDLLWKLLQWHPAQRIAAADALEHAFFTGAYTCEASGRSFATRRELALHEAYLAAQRERESAMAFVVRERFELPEAFTCPHCGRAFATVASCEQHMRARQHDHATHFCAFEAPALTQTIASETQAYRGVQPALFSTRADKAHTVGLALFQGRKRYMEDFVAAGYDAALDLEVFAVSDGHLGTRAAAFVAEHVVATVTRNLAAALASIDSSRSGDGASDPGPDRVFAERVALRQTFLELHARVLALDAPRNGSAPPQDFSGATLTLVLLFRSAQRVVSANVGDSRAIAVLRDAGAPDDVLPLSTDHWPNAPDERARIEASGGFVAFAGLWRVVGQLAVSRSIGDQHLRQYVTAEPSITHRPAPPGSVLVIASDGLWETMATDDVAHVVRARAPASATAQTLVRASYVRGSQDNTAVVVVEV